MSERERSEEGGREGEKEVKIGTNSEDRVESRTGGLLVQVYCPVEGAGCWETNESSRHLVHTGDCLSIQIAVFRLA